MTTNVRTSSQTESLDVEFKLSVSDIPDALKEEATAKAKEAYVMALLAAGEISSGKAASLLCIPRLEMIERMGQWGVSLFDDSMDIDELRQEVAQASTDIDDQHKSR